MNRLRFALLGMCALLWLSVSSFADPVAIGQLSFNQSLGNEFDINNFTGSNALPPDFPVLTGLTLSGTLTLTGQCGSSCVFSGITLGPTDTFDSTSNPLDIFASNAAFTSAVFQGTLGPTSNVILSGGTNPVSLANTFSVTLFNPLGLTARTDFAVIYANSVATSVPEPGSFMLMASGLAGLFAKRYLTQCLTKK